MHALYRVGRNRTGERTMPRSRPAAPWVFPPAFLLFCHVCLVSLSLSAEDFTHVAVLRSQSATAIEKKAIAMLLDESSRRTSLPWQETDSPEQAKRANCPLLIVARRAQIAPMLSGLSSSALRRWQILESPSATAPPEGFRIETVHVQGQSLLIVGGNDSRGVLFGIGQVLRTMEFTPGHAELPRSIHLTTAPQVPVRGHQIGYRYKNNTYDAWTLPQFEQHIRDLAIFGANSIQLIAPESDDAPTSPLYPAPALETLVGISRILGEYGLDCDLFFPELQKDYGDPSTVEKQLSSFEALVRQVPHIDALYIPGGDPGHTEPKLLLPLVAQEAAILRRYHPKAKVWLSAQGFSRAWYEQFYSLLAQQPKWLSGVFFGPQSRDGLPIQRARVPARYPIVFYPDIAHTMHAQFPVPSWDPAFALSEGREPINPRPLDETAIYRHLAPFQQGFITYSEGVNDDVNKFLWTRLGWSTDPSPVAALREYSRFFLGARIGLQSSDAFAESLMSLETNWRGPAATNANIATTLATLEAMEQQATPAQRTNWRFEEALYRALYDAYIQGRLVVETKQEEDAMRHLQQAPSSGSEAAIGKALADLQPRSANALAQERRTRLFSLAGSLFQHIGLQLSVARYGASAIERGANLDRVDVPLNDRIWLTKQLADISMLPTEPERLNRLDAIVHWGNPVAGTFYDDLGDPQQEPHLVKGEGFDQDPEFYRSSINGIADKTPDDGWRLSWITYAETLYETPTELRYTGLDPHQPYRIRITYAGEGYSTPMRLIANDTVEIHPALLRKANPSTLEFPLPREATTTGTLNLKWTGPDGAGGSGRGHQIAEVWIIPQDAESGGP